MSEIAALLLFALILAAFGRTLLRICARNAPLTEGERSVLGWGLGVVAVSTVLVFLAATDAFNRTVFAGLLAACLLAGAVEIHGLLRSLWRPDERPRSWGATALFWLGLAVPVGVALALALCPPFAKDALVYHLAVPKRYLIHGGMQYIGGNIYAAFPMGVEMLFSVGMAFGLEHFPALVHTTFFVMCAVCLRMLCRRFTGPWSASVLALLFALTPSAFVTAGWPYVDLAVVFSAVASLIGLLAWRESRRAGLLVAVAWIAGFGFCAKYTGGLVALTGVGLLLFWILTDRPEAGGEGGEAKRIVAGIFRALAFGAVAAIPMLPWLLRNIVYSANPLFPFLFEVFGGDAWDEFHAETFRQFLHGYGLGHRITDYLLLPVNLAFRGSWDRAPAEWEYTGFDGQIGPFYLLLLPVYVVMAFRRRPRDAANLGIFLAMTASAFVWTFTTQQVRFLLPTLALFLASTATVLPAVEQPPVRRRVLAAFLVVAATLVNFAYAAPYLARVNPLAYLTGKETREQFLTRGIHMFPLVQYVNEHTPPGANILLVQTGNRGYYLERRFYSDSVIEVKLIDELVRSSRTPEELCAHVAGCGFTHILLNTKYITRPVGDRNMPLVRVFFADYTKTLVEKPPFALVEILCKSRDVRYPSRSGTGSDGAGP